MVSFALLVLTAAIPQHEARMLADFASVSLERAAIIAGGPRDPATVKSALASLDTKLAPVLTEANEVGPDVRARRLVELLQVDFGRGALLRKLAPNAASLYDVIAGGRYNALSAALLFRVAAQRAGLEAAIVELEADVGVRVGSELFVFGATPVVTDADPALHVLSSSQSIALIYVQKAAAAAARADVAAFGEALTKSAALASDARSRIFSALVALTDDSARTPQENVTVFRFALAAAPDDAARERIERAVATQVDRRLFDDEALTPNEAEAWGTRLQPFARIRYELIARIDMKLGDLAGAGVSIDLGLRSCKEPVRCDALAALEAERLMAWSENDGQGAAVAFLKRFSDGRERYPDAARTIAKNQVLSLLNERRCQAGQVAAANWTGIIDPLDEAIEDCFVEKSVSLMKEKRYDVAADELRSAMKTVKDDTRVRTTLVNALSRQAIELIKQKRCDDAKPWLEEGRALDPNEALFDQGIAYCKKN